MSGSEDPELDKLYDEHMRERDPDKRKALIQAFEKRLFEQGYQQPLLWWHRIVPTHKALMGWKMSPSHNLGQDLAEVCAATVTKSRVPDAVRHANAAPLNRDPRHHRSRFCGAPRRAAQRPGHEANTMLRYTIHRVLLTIPTLLGVAMLVFFMLRIVPGTWSRSSCAAMAVTSRRRRSKPSAHAWASTSRRWSLSRTG